MRTVSTMERRLTQMIYLCALLCLFSAQSLVAAVVPMDREEVIQRSEAIFVATVAKKNVRWNDQGNMIVTDYVFTSSDVLFGNIKGEVTLTFAGGQLAEEGQSVSEVPEYFVGERVLLMVEDTRNPLLSPVTGMYQGSYVASQIEENGAALVLDGEGHLVVEKGEKVPFDAFVERVRREIPEAKAKPLPRREVPADLEHLVLRDLPVQAYDPDSVYELTPDARDADHPASAEDLAGPLSLGARRINGVDSQMGLDQHGRQADLPTHEWSYSHRAKNVPIVFNPLPSGGLIGSHDQYQMSYWNTYADIFRVMSSTGSWAWKNNRYDIAGFVNNATMISQFGSGWGSSTLAVCWLRWDSSGFSIEADIAMNPAFSWTVNDYDTYSNSSLYNADRTLLHEIGHAWGLNHQFNALSVMNYAPHKYRAYTVLSGDDTMAVRAAFSSKSVSRTDLGVALYYANGYQNYSDSTLSATFVPKGSTVTISNFMLENVGTTTISSPQVRWYLVPNINSWGSARYVGATTHSSLSSNSYWLTSRTLTIPASTPTGWYYIGAWIGMSSDSVGNNNSSWCGRRIYVY
ncbi:Matrixin family metalloprotease [Sulfidibacter corallicola]|uniref:Matrixin family metalloprotease n=1 Tax=Sulfidibacter corallicola TaxID=2818388 RepID=A0A8A4TL81_SULCO|nr:matrixin family metalloprotease [Sulfidibacter corallicola]QTD50300.1 matrixin family metalloprotease [Sulfidibacter corallicola]